jgi:lon-related putative ATP-dependent protease
MDISRLELAAREVAFSVNISGEACPEGSPCLGLGPGWGSEVIGQPRALEALKMGIGIKSKGYNVYVSGVPGTGRRTAVMSVLGKASCERCLLLDIAFVYNFDAPLAPKALVFEAGEGREFKRDLHRFVENLKRIVRLQSESESGKRAEAEALATLEAGENRRLSEFEAALATDGFRAVQVEADGGAGMDIVPIKPAPDGGEAVETSFEALQDLVASGELPEEDYNRLRERWYGHVDRMKHLFAELRKGRKDLEESLAAGRDEALRPQVRAETAILAERWQKPEQRVWIDRLGADVEERLYLFRVPGESPDGRRRRLPALARYGVNLVVDRNGMTTAPVVVESHPTAANLFGFIEPRPEDEGDTKISYLRIRSGSFLQAAGGFLVLRAEDVVADEEAWVRLKRVLQNGRVEIQPREGPQGISWVKPEPVAAAVKVIMIGGESTYDILYQTDADFQKLFKIHAEFDSTMPRDAAGLRDYAAFVRKIVDEEGLLPVTAEGLDAVAEEGVRLSDYRGRLSTRFGVVADLLRESDYRARAAGAGAIEAEAVRAAVAARARLANLPEEKIAEMIASGEIILQVQGTAVGRINGLAVHDRGYYAFGLPAVISAQVSPGESGLINIEGESGLSGEIYDKAVLIVEGFLRSRYARDVPLAVTAGICFEQSYTAIEGDSASSTAVYALLSAIAGIPLRQDIAVTGSLNQVGQVQPVGGVNEKIVGFYRVCQKTGLTGSQGVMIPRRNVMNLMLPREIQEAIEAGRFHIWAVSTIDEGLEVLSGIEAGQPGDRGEFPPSSFNGRVRRELIHMAKTIKNYLG